MLRVELLLISLILGIRTDSPILLPWMILACMMSRYDIIQAKNFDGNHTGKSVLIPRIKLVSTDFTLTPLQT